MTPYELRYRDVQVKQPNVETNEFIEKHLQRRTIRKYDPNRKISTEQLNYLFAAAQAAPSSSGAGSWSVITLTSPEEKQRFAAAAGAVISDTDPINKRCFEDCSVFVIWLLDNYKTEQAIRLVANKQIPDDISKKLLPERLQPGADTARPTSRDPNKLFEADPHVAHLDQSYYSFRAMADCIVAAQTFAMCAESLGMGTMYMGSIAHCDLGSFKNQLNLPDKTFPIFGMCVGYEHPGGSDHNGVDRSEVVLNYLRRNPDLKIKPVQPLELVVHQGWYDHSKVKPNLLKYNEIVWNYSKTVSPVHISDHMVCRTVARTKVVVNHIEQMRGMGNKFL